MMNNSNLTGESRSSNLLTEIGGLVYLLAHMDRILPSLIFYGIGNITGVIGKLTSTMKNKNKKKLILKFKDFCFLYFLRKHFNYWSNSCFKRTAIIKHKLVYFQSVSNGFNNKSDREQLDVFRSVENNQIFSANILFKTIV